MSTTDVNLDQFIRTLIHYTRITASSLSNSRYMVTVTLRNRHGDHSHRSITPADYLTRILAERLISEGAQKQTVLTVLREFHVPEIAFPGEDGEVMQQIVR